MPGWLAGGGFEGPQRAEDVGEDLRPRPVFGSSQGWGAGSVHETGGEVDQLDAHGAGHGEAMRSLWRWPTSSTGSVSLTAPDCKANFAVSCKVDYAEVLLGVWWDAA